MYTTAELIYINLIHNVHILKTALKLMELKERQKENIM